MWEWIKNRKFAPSNKQAYMSELLDHLNYIAQSFPDIDKSEGNKNERHIEAERSRADGSAEKERARVAHKNLRGVEIENEEADKAARKRGAEHSD